jgi:hypothetical protein
VLGSARGCRPVSRERGDRAAQGLVASSDERRHTPLERPALDQNVTGAALAAQSDVGPQPINEPLLGSARVRAPQPDDIAEPELDHAAVSGGHCGCPSGR